MTTTMDTAYRMAATRHQTRYKLIERGLLVAGINPTERAVTGLLARFETAETRHLKRLARRSVPSGRGRLAAGAVD